MYLWSHVKIPLSLEQINFTIFKEFSNAHPHTHTIKNKNNVVVFVPLQNENFCSHLFQNKNKIIMSNYS